MSSIPTIEPIQYTAAERLQHWRELRQTIAENRYQKCNWTMVGQECRCVSGVAYQLIIDATGGR